MSWSTATGGYRRDVPHGLMFHRFHGAPNPNGWQGALTSDEFEQILLYVGVDRILSPDEWLSRLEAGRLTGDDLCVTFDDGLRCQAEWALPVLERYRLQAFWFVYSCVADGIAVKGEIYSYVAGQIGGMPVLIKELLARCPAEMRRALASEEFRVYAAELLAVAPFYTEDDLKFRFLRNSPRTAPGFEELMDAIIAEHVKPAELIRQLWLEDADLKALAAANHSIGLHSYDHPYAMADLTGDQQRAQYTMNQARLTAATGTPPWSMSHPLNSYNEDSLAVLQHLGIRCGFRANLAPPAKAGVNPGPLEWAREDSATLLQLVQHAPKPLNDQPLRTLRTS